MHRNNPLPTKAAASPEKSTLCRSQLRKSRRISPTAVATVAGVK
ncbi:hypothetical protein EM6_1638 [Asticcacaulis excentricus]|uniref:Uncharacterized protein n=1 Tax=Asticcacaulis excentricus TaxID=78587 RepID=A0A3G9G7A5_9CAUL|nr:hypothetical protein EM6_1638 [Asticcacaulis excentricus]